MGRHRFTVLLLTSVILFAAGQAVSTHDPDGLYGTNLLMWTGLANEIRQSALPLTHGDLLRSPERYEGSPIVITGKIEQHTLPPEGSTVHQYRIRVAEDGVWGGDVFLLITDTHMRVPLLEGDIIDVAGYAGGVVASKPLVYGFDVRRLAKRSDPWPPTPLTEAEALEVVCSSAIYKQAVEAYAEWWAGVSGSETLNISHSVSSSTLPDGIDRWWIVTTNTDADPNIRSQAQVSLLCVDKLTKELYIYMATESLMLRQEGGL